MNPISLLFSDKRANFCSLFYALLFTGAFFLGQALEKDNTIFTQYDIKAIIILFFAIFLTSLFFLKNSAKIEECIKKITPINWLNKLFFEPNLKCFLFTFVFLILCGIPSFLAYYPGIFTYDTYWQSVFFAEKDFVEYHPLLHTILVYLAVLISKFFNTSTGGVLIYTIFQALTAYFAYTYCIYVQNKFKVCFSIKLITLLFFAFYPTNHVFPLVATKDVYFCSFTLLFILLMTELLFEKEKFLNIKNKCIYLSLTIIGMFLFRHNGIHSYLLILPIILFFFMKTIPQKRKAIAIIFLVPILFHIGFCATKKIIKIKPAPLALSLNIPIQQMGRVFFFHSDTLSVKDKETFKRIVNPTVAEKYEPATSDILLKDEDILHCKYVNNSIKKAPRQFMKLYLKWLNLYPKEYIDAPLINHYTYWYFPANYNTFDLHYYLYTENRWDDYWGTKIEMRPINKDLRDFYNSIYLDTIWQKHWYLKVFFSIPLNTWYVITAFFILLYRRKYNFLIPIVIIPAIFLTVFFGPTTLLRYVYQNFLVIPMLLAFCFGSIEKNNK